MFETFLTIMVLSFSLSIYEDKNEPQNYGYFQEDYWEQIDINSMDWDHPLRENPFGALPTPDDDQENRRGIYFPDDDPIKKDMPPVENPKKDKDNEEKPLIASIK